MLVGVCCPSSHPGIYIAPVQVQGLQHAQLAPYSKAALGDSGDYALMQACNTSQTGWMHFLLIDVYLIVSSSTSRHGEVEIAE